MISKVNAAKAESPRGSPGSATPSNRLGRGAATGTGRSQPPAAQQAVYVAEFEAGSLSLQPGVAKLAPHPMQRSGRH